MNNEIDLLCQAIQSQDSVENNGVKFLYMDENTIYRFQNNKMKPISKTLLNKAKKLINQQTQPAETTKPKRGKGKKATRQQQVKEVIESETEESEEDEEMEESEEDEMIINQQSKPSKQAKQTNKQAKREALGEASKQASKQAKQTSKQQRNEFIPYGEIDLNEYYNNKNRMEFMNREMDRLNQKITKLKQYKHLVNKITGGGEIDDLPSNTQSYDQETTQLRATATRQVNDSLFM